MTTHIWMARALLALLVIAGVGVAEADVIYPVDPVSGLPNRSATAVTISILDANGRDITDQWLPTWEPGRTSTVYIGFNAQGLPATATAIALKADVLLPATLDGLTNPFVKAPNPATNTLLVLSTSRYPGQCTNYGTRSNPEPLDFDPALTPTTVPIGAANGRPVFTLTSLDCGGMAVITATVNGLPWTYIVPQDSNLNGIPDIWENQFCPNNTCPVGNEDNDAGPIATSPTGDGIAAFDEYRGFIIGGQHFSTDPRRRDLFVTLGTAQCGDPAQAYLGGGATTFPTDGTGAFDNLASLVPGSQIHLRNYRSPQGSALAAEWIDRLASYTEQLDPTTGRSGFKYLDAAGTVTYVPPVDDRRINANAIFAPVGLVIHRGLRLTECLDPGTAPQGSTGLGSPDGEDNSIVYTERIVSFFDGMIAASTKPLKLFVFQNGAWVEKTKPDGTPVDRNYLISQAIKFYVAHELAHGTRLTPTVEGTNKTTYGYHHAPGTGSVMDQQIVQKIDSKSNAFYIPAVYNNADQGNYKVRD